jgi:GT2 family glycosyltransferase
VDSKKTISIIIPNYNGKKLLEEYLPYTLAAIEGADVAFEIIVVDDSSKDDSVAFMQGQYPQVKLLVNEQNKGFSYTCNQGIAAAQYELILLLNSDVKLTPGYFEHQFRYFNADDTFGVMGRIIDMEGDNIQDAARMPKFNGLKLKTDYFYYTDTTDDNLYTLYLSGANAFIDAAKLKAIGGFDEIFSPFYSEDMELSLRAWRMGWKCYYEHGSICRHQVSASTKNYKTAGWVKRVYNRNRFFVHAIHLDGLAFVLWFLQISLIDMLPKLVTGQFWMWKSYIDFLKHLDAVRASRGRLKALMQENKSTLSIFDVTDLIKDSISGKAITRFDT